MHLKGAKSRLSSELIGIEDGKYLIVKMPPMHTMDNVSSLLRNGNDVAVKYMYKGTIFGFQSQIIDLIYNPFKLVFIEYPEKIESYDFRGNKRVECFLPANIRIAEHKIEGCITDISKAGCLLDIETPKLEDSINFLELNNEICVGFHLPGVEEELGVTAKQRSIKKDAENVRIGIEFVNMDSSVQSKLFDFLAIAEA
jgi:c-di-GMP-binding flagellar brake protein YcgR